MSLLIRRYKPGDFEEVWKLHNIALQQTGAHFGNGSWDDDLNNIQVVYLENRGEFLVGLSEDHIVAMGALKNISEQKAEIKRMRVHPDFQRRGFGQGILDALEAKARELGYKVLGLDTTVLQVAAQHLYIKKGYREVRREKTENFELIFYEKEI